MWYSVGILPYPNEPPREGLSLGAGALSAPKRGAEPPLHAKQPVQRNAEGVRWPPPAIDGGGRAPPRSPCEAKGPPLGDPPPSPSRRTHSTKRRTPGRPRGSHLFSLMSCALLQSMKPIQRNTESVQQSFQGGAGPPQVPVQQNTDHL